MESNMVVQMLLCSVLLWVQASTQVSRSCPFSIAHDRYNQVFQDRCYRFVFHAKLEYFNAERYCNTKGGQLAMPKTSDINAFLTDHLKFTYRYANDVWIGLNDYDEENTFQWVDGTKLGDSYSNWLNDDEGPRGGIKHPFRHRYEDCVSLDASYDGKWLDHRCDDLFLIDDEHKFFVCEFPVLVTRKTTTTTTTTPTPTATTTAATTPTATTTTATTTTTPTERDTTRLPEPTASSTPQSSTTDKVMTTTTTNVMTSRPTTKETTTTTMETTSQINATRQNITKKTTQNTKPTENKSTIPIDVLTPTIPTRTGISQKSSDIAHETTLTPLATKTSQMKRKNYQLHVHKK